MAIACKRCGLNIYIDACLCEVRTAVEDERKACAAVCEQYARELRKEMLDGADTANRCAEKIRARGEK